MNTSVYPVIENHQYVDGEQTREYLDMLFGSVIWQPHHMVAVRALGEKGTIREGTHRDEIWLQPGVMENGEEAMAAAICRYAREWAAHHVAGFIIPAVMKEAKGSSESVELFTTIVVDLDTGDTDAKLEWLERYVGPATMVVGSGGVTDEGKTKYHVYWRLSDPTDDIRMVVDLRDEIARKAGGDHQFGRGQNANPYGRAHQPIRIPGTCHAKHGMAKPCHIIRSQWMLYDLYHLAAAIRAMPAGPWVKEEQGSLLAARSTMTSTSGQVLAGSMQFSAAGAPGDKPPIEDTLLQEIHEGSDDDKNRWTEFNRVSGHYIRLARQNLITLDDARESTFGWAITKMVPCWPQPRLEREWHQIMQRDIQRNGPFIETFSGQAMTAPADEKGEAKPLEKTDEGLVSWAAHRWLPSSTPTRKWLVHGLVQDGKHHMLVSEGGAGKTMALLDLCMAVASGDAMQKEIKWLGGILDTSAAGTVVMLTTEDDGDELAIRMRELDTDGRIKRAGDRLIIVPTISYGGSFPLVGKDRYGNTGDSPQWTQFKALLSRLPEATGAPVKLVVIDTLNSTLHGDENGAITINEYVRAATWVCGHLNAALVVTHHIRKQGQEPIRNAEDMKSAVRGSSAMTAAFRGVLGIWHCSDFNRRLKGMGEKVEKGMVYKMAVLKANNPEAIKDEITLLRGKNGLLQDATHLDKFSTPNLPERQAWMLFVCKKAAAAGYPYRANARHADGVFSRRGELPEILQNMSFRELDKLATNLMESGEIVACSAKGSASRNYLDVPDGAYATNVAGEQVAKGAWTVDDRPNWSKYEYNDAIGAVVEVGTPSLKKNL